MKKLSLWITKLRLVAKPAPPAQVALMQRAIERAFFRWTLLTTKEPVRNSFIQDFHFGTGVASTIHPNRPASEHTLGIPSRASYWRLDADSTGLQAHLTLPESPKH